MLPFPRLLLGALTGAAVALAAGTANASLIISVNGGPVATDPTNTIATFNGSAGGWNIVNVVFTGIAALVNPHVADVGTASVSTSGVATDLTISDTETNLTGGAPGFIGFLSNFTNTLPTNLSFTRSFYLDPTNSGLLTDLLGSVSGSTSLNTDISSSLFPVTGPYSITESMTFHVIAAGHPASVSADDDLHSVPEPSTLVLLGTALLGLGFLHFRKKKAAWV